MTEERPFVQRLTYVELKAAYESADLGTKPPEDAFISGRAMNAILGRQDFEVDAVYHLSRSGLRKLLDEEDVF
jgi:hypothetical protein